MKMFITDLLDLLFPEHCIGCNKEGSALCAICERTITTKATALSGTTATLFDYHHPLVKKAIWALKYERRRSLAGYFGTALYREFFKSLARSGGHSKESIVLIPIPGGKKAVSVRGYNHATLIAEAIRACAKQDRLLISVENNVLYKAHEITQQVRARGKSNREKNVEGIFRIHNTEKIAGKTVILIDDVITTGATIAEAKRAVRSAKPKRVLAIAVAH
jgi:competence protein ComFC